MLKLFISETHLATHLQQCCSKEENQLTQKTVGWRKSSILHFPREIVLGPEQMKAINSEKRVILLMGEAGTGKTTVLLATLFKYTGKHVTEEARKKVVFSIPYHKKTFKNDIVSFVEQFCVREWVEILLGFDEEKVCRNSGSTVYLFDEVYDTNFISRILERGKVFAVVIPGEKMLFESEIFRLPRSDLKLIYFRKIYRTPADISNCCVKLKRLLDKKSMKAKNLSGHFTHQYIPWEMSFSTSTPLREGNSIELRSYQSLQMEDLRSCIGKSDLIVSLNFEKKKVEKLNIIFDTNTIFHENSIEQTENHPTALQRLGEEGGVEIIILICGKSFTKEYLISQQGLLWYLELKQCVAYVICDYRVLKKMKHFSFNFETRVFDEGAKFGSKSLLEKCQKLRREIFQSTISEFKALVISFCQTMESVELINTLFQIPVVIHVNVHVTRMGVKNRAIKGQGNWNNTIFKKIVLVSELHIWDEAPLLYSSQGCMKLVRENCPLTLIRDCVPLECCKWISSLLENLREDIIEKLTESLLTNKISIRTKISRACTKSRVAWINYNCRSQNVTKTFNQCLTRLGDYDLTVFLDDYTRELLEKVVDKILIEVSGEIFPERIGFAKLVDECLAKTLDNEMMSSDPEHLLKVIEEAKRVVREVWRDLGDRLKLILETSRDFCEKDAIERVLKNHLFNQSTQENIMESFEKKGFCRFIEKNLRKFNKNDLRELNNTFACGNLTSRRWSRWVRRNLKSFNGDVLRSLILECQDMRLLLDFTLENFDIKKTRLCLHHHLRSRSVFVKISEWVIKNLDNFTEEELRSLAARNLRYFKYLHEKFEVSDFNESSMRCTLNAFDAESLKKLIIQYSETFSQDTKKRLRANSSMFNETVLSSCNIIELIDPQYEGLKTLISDDLEKWARRCLRNIEILRMLTDNYEEKRFRAGLASKLIAKVPSESMIDCLSESLYDTLKTLLPENEIRHIKPLKQLWELTQQSSILSSFTDSAQITHVSTVFNCSNLNRLLITFYVNPKLCKLLESFFCNYKVIHSGVHKLQIDCSCRSLRKQHSCRKNQEAIFSRDENMLKQVDNYDSIIFVVPKNMDIHPTSSAFQTAFPHIGECSEFFCVSDKEFYENLVTEKFQLNGRPFFEILKYSDSSTVNEIIELIPLFENQRTLLLVWNVEETFSKKIIHSFVQYECECIPSTQAEPWRLQTNSREINSLILVCGQLKSKTYLTEVMLDTITQLRIEGSIYIVCHSINSNHIKSVFLSCKKYNFLERKVLLNLPQEPFDIINIIPTIEANKEIEVLILTWKAPRSISSYINDTFQNCTIRSVDQQSNFPESAYDEVILVCCAEL